MKAPKISQTVTFEKPDSAQDNAALAGLKPGFASSAGAYNAQGERTVTSVTPMRPMAPPGNGSSIRPTITPAKIAKKYQACGASPVGAGSSAITTATTMGAIAFQEIVMSLSFAKAGQPAGHRSHTTHVLPAGADELEDGVIVFHVRTMGFDPGQKTMGYWAEWGLGFPLPSVFTERHAQLSTGAPWVATSFR
ncbi:hypothetical protein GALL_503330 [mine drainage metagenome]|uniref:Uncharacterized protein n=1 Tax=mine drainage metagenome TaxID=410659 RepID=A0A1J5PBH9_9ZZZZ